MPAPAAFAMMAARHMALHTSASSAFAAVLAQWMWKQLPLWIKEDISFQNLLKDKKEVTQEELSHLGSVVEKLQEMVKSTKGIYVPQLHATFLAYIQLSCQIKLSQPKLQEQMTRNYLYKSSGKPFSMRRLQSPEFQDALNFATWAYHDDSQVIQEKIHKHGYTLLNHHLPLRPGNVAYFLAVSHEKKRLLVGIRGTSSLEDILTDCCSRAVSLEGKNDDDNSCIEVQMATESEMHLANDDKAEIKSRRERILLEDCNNGDNYIWCHEGILISSESMVRKIKPFIIDLIEECDYSVMLCGHSLGAGAATLSALILRSRFPKLTTNQKLRVYAFGPPPVLDRDSAVAAASFCTSVVNNADIIPRCSLYNFAVFLECLRKVQLRLVEKEMSPTGLISTKAFIDKLSEGTSGKLLMTVSELNKTAREAHEQTTPHKPEHLYIPGRVIMPYNPLIEDFEGEDDDEIDQLKPEQKTWLCTETDGTAAVFRNVEVDGARLFTDHASSSYFEALGMDYDF
mmetsp:Transcript_21165/g.42411  ORF Transcript_21165/g.42411 Transcript_21165/m.42411 type:complete len:513 (-) Transcript_21165:668-2206(-)